MHSKDSKPMYIGKAAQLCYIKEKDSIQEWASIKNEIQFKQEGYYEKVYLWVYGSPYGNINVKLQLCWGQKLLQQKI